MVRFSCFASPNHHHRAKKVSQHSDGAMHIDSCVASQDQVVKASNGLVMKNPKPEGYNPSHNSADQISSPSSYWKSEDLNDNLSLEESKTFLQTTCLKKSQSLGCILEKGRGFSLDDGFEDIEMEQRFSCGNSCDKNIHDITDPLKNSGLAESFAPENCHENLAVKSHHKENDIVESFEFSADPVHNKSLFFISTPKQYDGDQSDAGEKPVDRVRCYSSETQPIFGRSRSLTNIRVVNDNSTKRASTPEFLGPVSVSLEDFILLKAERADSQNIDGCAGNTCHMPRAASYSHDMTKALDSDEKSSAGRADSVEGHAKSGGCNEAEDNYGDGLSWGERIKHDDRSADGDDFHMYNGLMDEWRKPKSNNAEIGHELQQQSPIQNCDELRSKEFNIKRIEEWISQIDIDNSCPLEEPGETSYSDSKKDHHIAPDTTAAKVEVQTGPGMEAAHHYISSLTAASSSAQMANLGLIVIPFLGPFVSLRVLNLSGNSIVRITAGALPRGLHMLNLSKNNISTIEGLRELTRLRVLDLSYNRISRIAHGLASCSSLKELYLAGNKISEVEGLHRLLKLNVLDLRFNKISTSKGLGQLAANYLSLQAINLEGNPAQKNVGDEQLKKYLLSLLPNLVYFNKQTTRSVSLKEIPDRSTRSITASDRGMRADHKHTRRGVHGASLYKSVASSGHGRSSNALSSLMKQSKSRHGHLLPATVPKAGHHSANTSNKLLSLKPTSTMRRIQSEGTLPK